MNVKYLVLLFSFIQDELHIGKQGIQSDLEFRGRPYHEI